MARSKSRKPHQLLNDFLLTAVRASCRRPTVRYSSRGIFAAAIWRSVIDQRQQFSGGDTVALCGVVEQTGDMAHARNSSDSIEKWQSNHGGNPFLFCSRDGTCLTIIRRMRTRKCAVCPTTNVEYIIMNRDFMRESIRLAERGVSLGRGGPFGAVVVQGGKIISRGSNAVTSRNDPTAHAEIVAIRAAGRRLRTFDLGDCEIYTSCEPCPMCLAAIYWARLRRVYYANTRRDAAKIGFDDAAFYRELTRPISKRRLPTKQLMRNEALNAFKIWRGKPDKVKY